MLRKQLQPHSAEAPTHPHDRQTEHCGDTWRDVGNEWCWNKRNHEMHHKPKPSEDTARMAATPMTEADLQHDDRMAERCVARTVRSSRSPAGTGMSTPVAAQQTFSTSCWPLGG